jgi:drug/metabolite transporter (DMT)-like permease
MSERFGVGLGVLSCSFGAGAAVATRFLVGDIDAITIAAARFGGGALLLLPIAFAARSRWPSRADWPAVAALGILFYAVFFILYNVALRYTTVARGTLALSTLPLVTMAVAALLGREMLSLRKTTGVFVAVAGVAFALTSGLEEAPVGAWRGDVLMAGATLCMALYSVWSRPLAARSSALGFLVAGMAAGGAVVALASLATGGASGFWSLTPVQWMAVAYLAAGGGALAFALWVFALEYATPTRVTNTMTVNPLVAGLSAYVLLGEPLSLNFAAGLVAVFAGIWISTAGGKDAR